MDREERRSAVFMKCLNNRLIEIGLTAREAAKKCGLTEVTMSRYLHGSRIPGIHELGKIVDGVGMDVREFLYMDNDDLSWDEIFEEFKKRAFGGSDRAKYQVMMRYTIELEHPRVISVMDLSGESVYLYDHTGKTLKRMALKEYQKWVKKKNL